MSETFANLLKLKVSGKFPEMNNPDPSTMSYQIIYFNWLCPECNDRFDSDYKSLNGSMCIYCEADASPTAEQREDITLERTEVKRRLSFGTEWSCPTPGCVSGIIAPLDGETVCYDCLIEENRVLYEASRSVIDDDQLPSPPPRLHRQHACRYYCSVCDAPTSNSCMDCNTHCECH